MDNLPRDVQLQIIKRADMDARIKCGWVRRLHIPQNIEAKLGDVFTPRTIKTECPLVPPNDHTYTANRRVVTDTISCVFIGRRWDFLRGWQPVYEISYQHYSRPTWQGGWSVAHFQPGDKATKVYRSIDNANWK